VGISKLLEEDRARFISLRELFFILTNHGNGCSRKEAAEFLEQKFSRISLGELPLFHKLSSDNVISPIILSTNKNWRKASLYIAEHMIGKEDKDENNYRNCDDLGFNRREIRYFLSSFGIEISKKNLLPPTPSKSEMPMPMPMPMPAIPDPLSHWPWGEHHTEALGHLEATAKRFWTRYDPSDLTTAPTNKTVSDWLQSERGVKEDKAKAIASILRPDGLPTGPRK
jgi:hypothetical protein